LPKFKIRIFAQAHAIAPSLLGWTFYQFRNRYFQKREKWEWVEKKGNLKRVNK